MGPDLVHRSASLRVQFDERGVELTPLFGSPVLIAWEEVEFACPVPAMERHPEGWSPKPNSFLSAGFKSTLDLAGYLELNLVIRDRRPILSRVPGWWTRAWLAGQLRAMFDASDRPMPDQSLLRLHIYRRRIDLDRLLDLLSERCRFDLVVDF